MPDFPNLFIVGAPKCGTTSLHSILNLHPEIGMSEPKELNFFSSEDLANQNLYYNDFKVSTFENYMKCFLLNADFNYVGESSVSYFSYPNAHKKIYRHNKNSRIIVLLRNPIKRAYSHYLMDKRLGYVKLDFLEIFNNPEKYPSYYYQYFVLSQYYHPLASLKTIFNKNLYVQLLDGGDSMSTIAEKIVSWLGLKNYNKEINIDEFKENVFFLTKSKIISSMYQIFWFRNTIKKIVPTPLQKYLLGSLSGEKPKLENEVQETLLEFFINDVNQTEKLIGQDLTSWKSL